MHHTETTLYREGLASLDYAIAGRKYHLVMDAPFSPGALKEHEGTELLRRLFVNATSYTVHPTGGECAKTIENVTHNLSVMSRNNHDRGSVVVALGGGAICDMAGFVASTWMRGVPVIMVPTTLLAMVDASIGGKNAINVNGIKNLMGTFHIPETVITDISLLTPEVIRPGFGEIIKMAMLESTIKQQGKDEEVLWGILDRMDQRPDDLLLLKSAIGVAQALKVRVIDQDLYESTYNGRVLLNLGHTLAHAIEMSSHPLPHGDAVAVGLVAMTKYASTLDSDLAPLVRRVEKAVSRFTDASAFDVPAGERIKMVRDLVETMLHDKKREGDGIRMVVPATGKVTTEVFTESRLLELATMAVGSAFHTD